LRPSSVSIRQGYKRIANAPFFKLLPPQARRTLLGRISTSVEARFESALQLIDVMRVLRIRVLLSLLLTLRIGLVLHAPAVDRPRKGTVAGALAGISADRTAHRADGCPSGCTARSPALHRRVRCRRWFCGG
jgi:hypothetical protein